jgi:hypothetical protein
VLPGTILRANFLKPASIEPPHFEDSIIVNDKISVVRTATSDEFRQALDASAFPDVSSGFGVAMNGSKKYSVQLATPARSIFTLRIAPENFTVFEDNYGKLRAHVTDSTGTTYQYLSVTDLGFFDYVGNPDTRRMTSAEALAAIHKQQELYLRIGLSRAYEGNLWLQVNGIYTFPDYSLVLRQY